MLLGSIKMKEIEIKIKIENIKEIRDKILKLNVEFIKTEKEIDEYFDFEDKTLINADKTLRIRNKEVVCFKGPRENNQTFQRKARSLKDSCDKRISEETETKIQNYENFINFLNKSGIKVSFVKEKMREYFKKDNLIITIDTLPCLGSFIEIEGPEEAIDNAAKKLGFSKDDYITEIYSELFNKFKKENNIQAKWMVFENDDQK